MEDDAIDVTVKFKRRRVAHTKRTHLEVGHDDAVAATQSPNTVTIAENEEPPAEGDETSATLKEILRNRKRPRDRLREAAARAELTKTQALHRREQDAPKQGYAERFVPQTGQVVDRDDEQMYVYQPSVPGFNKSIAISINVECWEWWLTSQYGIHRRPLG